MKKGKLISMLLGVLFALSMFSMPASAQTVIENVRMGTYVCYEDNGETYQEAFRPMLTLRSDKTFSALVNLGSGMGVAQGTWTAWQYEGTSIYLRITETDYSDGEEYELKHLSHPFLENDIFYHFSIYTEYNHIPSTWDNDDVYVQDWLGITGDVTFTFASDDEKGFVLKVEYTANPTSSAVLINGQTVAFDAYNINNNNYFKLRDLAYILNGTQKQFAVDWDGANNTILLTSGQPYVAVGGEMAGKGTGTKTAISTSSKIMLDGKEVSFTAYYIEGNNYFKLRDVGETFNFGVDWDGANNTIRIDTSKGYTPEGA